jgi:hypothetical protein
MGPEEFAQNVESFLSDCFLTESDLESGVPLGKMKTLTAYVSLYTAKSYQSNREITETAPIGGSTQAREVAQGVSNIVQIDAVMRTLLQPQVMRQASRL